MEEVENLVFSQYMVSRRFNRI